MAIERVLDVAPLKVMLQLGRNCPAKPYTYDQIHMTKIRLRNRPRLRQRMLNLSAEHRNCHTKIGLLLSLNSCNSSSVALATCVSTAEEHPRVFLSRMSLAERGF